TNIEGEDLLKFGLIPEFIGRLPVITVVDPLDEQALVEILVKPKNAITKQFKKIFEYENVELVFEDDALKMVAKLAMEKGNGARGLRAILEKILLETMYEIPSKKDIAKVVITLDVVEKGGKPVIIYKDNIEREIA
ncbi:MAG: ATP-dependent Clp protease ATP-binding subunit ClpX, partial [bacterium]